MTDPAASGHPTTAATSASSADGRRPDPGGRVRGALQRYRVLAWITGVWLLVLTGEIVYKYVLLDDSSTAPHWLFYIGQAHGVFYLLYLVFTVDLGIKARWPLPTTLLTALAGTIPLLSFVFEHQRTRDVRTTWAV